jgi:hypothetical protein
MLHSKVDGCCMEVFGTRLLGRRFWGRICYDGLLCTDLNSAWWAEDGQRLSGDGRWFYGRGGGRMFHSKVDGCCMELFGRRVPDPDVFQRRKPHVDQIHRASPLRD